MPTTEIWSLPPTIPDGWNHDLMDMTRPDDGRIYYVKGNVGALGMLDPAAKAVREWLLTGAMTPPPAIKGNGATGSLARVALTPGRQKQRLWAALDGWHALAELDPATSELRIFSADPPDAVPQSAGFPFSGVCAVLPESATKIWFAARDYANNCPVIGVLDSAAGRASYWRLGGPATNHSVEDLVRGADGRIWFACHCSRDAPAGQDVVFLGVLDPSMRKLRYFLTPNMPAFMPDHWVGVRRLGARNRASASAIWLMLRYFYGASLLTVDTATDVISGHAGTVTYFDMPWAEGLFCIGFPRANEVAVGLRDVLRVCKDKTGCVSPGIFPHADEIVRAQTCNVAAAVYKPAPKVSKAPRRKVNRAVLDMACTRDITPAAPGICGLAQGDTGGRLWLGHWVGSEIGLMTP